MAGRKNDLGIALALQHLFVHFLVAGLIATLAAGGVHNDFAAGGARLRVECDAATLEFESAMDGVHGSSHRPLDFGLGGIEIDRGLLRRHHRRQQRQPGEPRDTARRHTGRVTVSSFDFPVSSAPAIVEPAKLWASIAGWLAGGHLFLLAVLRYNDLPAENVSRLSKGQVIGHWLEITAGFGLLHVDCLEEESFSFHVHSHGSHFPMARRNFGLPDLKMAPLVQVSQQAASKFNVLHETTIHCGKSFLFDVDPNFAFHVMKNTGLQRRRLKILVWSEAQLYQVSLTARVVEGSSQFPSLNTCTQKAAQNRTHP